MTDNVLAIDPPANTRAICDALYAVAQSMRGARELAIGEAALDRIAETLDMPWPCWVFDISHPYYCPQQDKYSRKIGWPDELQQLWWSRHVALKMPLYIRCRFEHLPFVTALDPKTKPRTVRLSAERQRVNQLMRGLGISSMITVPLHLPKGQVGMITWAGNRDPHELNALLDTITGCLLSVGYNFMRIHDSQPGQRKNLTEEHVQLTPREWDCLRTLAQGYREVEVAQVTGISKATVRYHLDNVVQKFGCKHRIQAVAIVAQLGLLDPVRPKVIAGKRRAGSSSRLPRFEAAPIDCKTAISLSDRKLHELDRETELGF